MLRLRERSGTADAIAGGIMEDTSYPCTGMMAGDAEPARNPPSLPLLPATEGGYNWIADAGCAERSVCSAPRQPMIDAARRSEEGAEICGSIPETIPDPVSRYSRRMVCDGNGPLPDGRRNQGSGPGNRNGRKSAICATDSGFIVRIVQFPNRPKCMLFTPRNTIPICTDYPLKRYVNAIILLPAPPHGTPL